MPPCPAGSYVIGRWSGERLHQRIPAHEPDQDAVISVVVPCFNEEQALPVFIPP